MFRFFFLALALLSPNSQAQVTLVQPSVRTTAVVRPDRRPESRGDLITFQSYSTGQVLDAVVSQGGLGPFPVLGTQPNLPGQNAAVVFDTFNPPAGLERLGSPNSSVGGAGLGAAGGWHSRTRNIIPIGRALVLARDLDDLDNNGRVDRPADAQVSGELEIDFSSVAGATIYSLVALDLEDRDGPTTVHFYGQNDELITVRTLPETGPNGLFSSTFAGESGVRGVERLVIRSQGSGVFDSLRFIEDCDRDGLADGAQIASGASPDVNNNGLPDVCEEDCNENGLPDSFEISQVASIDMDQNGVPDECEPDCDLDGILDADEPDCDGDGIPDDCDDQNLIAHVRCVEGADPDSFSTRLPGSFAVQFTDLLGNDFETVGRVEFIEFSDGQAKLEGLMARTDEPSQQFLFDLGFSSRRDPVDPLYPPPGTPLLTGLDSSALAMNGGPVPASTWHYYEQTDGVLIGFGALQGALYLVQGDGPALQVGIGASRKNVADGLSGGLALTLLQPVDSGIPLPATSLGDLRLNFADCVPEFLLDRCLKNAEGDPLLGAVETSGALLSGLSTEFDFVEFGGLEEFPDGNAGLNGRLVDRSDPTRGFDLTFFFGARLDPGDAAYPPLGSPVATLDPSAYQAGGGPVQPTDWRYYQTVVGTATGFGEYAGALYDASENGPAFQIGFGASERNVSFGSFGGFELQEVSQPTGGTLLPSSMVGELYVELPVCPNPCQG